MTGKPKRYTVTGAYITVKTMTLDGLRVLGLYAGSPVPADIDPDHLKGLIDHDLVAEVAEPASAPAPEAPPEAKAKPEPKITPAEDKPDTPARSPRPGPR